MSEFFESEVVQEELQDITDLQKELYGSMLDFGSLSEDDKKEHIESLIGIDKELIEVDLFADPDQLSFVNVILTESSIKQQF